MNYLEWELERQRGALRALLGGGNREDSRKDGSERVWAEPEASDSSAGQAERAGASTGRETGPSAERATDRPAEQSALRRDGTGRREGMDAGEPAGPLSAWEQVLNGTEDAPGRLAGPEEEPPETPGRPLREGTGPQAALPGAAGERPAAGETEETLETLEGAGGRRDGGSAGEAFTTGYRLTKGWPAWAPETGETGYRDMGLAAAPAEEDRVRALSRAVQRDARRYDGGFTIY